MLLAYKYMCLSSCCVYNNRKHITIADADDCEVAHHHGGDAAVVLHHTRRGGACCRPVLLLSVVYCLCWVGLCSCLWVDGFLLTNAHADSASWEGVERIRRHGYTTKARLLHMLGDADDSTAAALAVDQPTTENLLAVTEPSPSEQDIPHTAHVDAPVVVRPKINIPTSTLLSVSRAKHRSTTDALPCHAETTCRDDKRRQYLLQVPMYNVVTKKFSGGDVGTVADWLESTGIKLSPPVLTTKQTQPESQTMMIPPSSIDHMTAVIKYIRTRSSGGVEMGDDIAVVERLERVHKLLSQMSFHWMDDDAVDVQYSNEHYAAVTEQAKFCVHMFVRCTHHAAQGNSNVNKRGMWGGKRQMAENVASSRSTTTQQQDCMTLVVVAPATQLLLDLSFDTSSGDISIVEGPPFSSSMGNLKSLVTFVDDTLTKLNLGQHCDVSEFEERGLTKAAVLMGIIGVPKRDEKSGKAPFLPATYNVITQEFSDNRGSKDVDTRYDTCGVTLAPPIPVDIDLWTSLGNCQHRAEVTNPSIIVKYALTRSSDRREFGDEISGDERLRRVHTAVSQLKLVVGLCSGGGVRGVCRQMWNNSQSYREVTEGGKLVVNLFVRFIETWNSSSRQWLSNQEEGAAASLGGRTPPTYDCVLLFVVSPATLSSLCLSEKNINMYKQQQQQQQCVAGLTMVDDETENIYLGQHSDVAEIENYTITAIAKQAGMIASW
eukprot:GHVQ01011985.1.p1 GENE.GHVQ01011985.1~~GHVQ01011985.1.p1  ORF type:complete len:716 (+),score=141.96 GHVQ01011985.1:227-2374(+)